MTAHGGERTARPRRLLLTGGGTGGHIYPALSIAVRAREITPELEILYVGTSDGLEARLVPPSGIPFTAIPARGLVGKSSWHGFKGLWVAAAGFGQALRLLRRFRPQVVVGTGGYVSGPVAAAAVALRLPLVLQEQNVVPGVTNRLLSPFAACVAVAYEESRAFFPRSARLVVTGNPVRPEVSRGDREPARARLDLPRGAALVVIFMGSRGSTTVNEAVVDMLPRLAGRDDLVCLFATGERHFPGVVARLRRAGLSPWEARPPGRPEAGEEVAGVPPGDGTAVRLAGNIEVRPYIHDMVDVLAAADLVVARAGAITLAEITARGLPAILIPSPHVTHRHQERNAEVLARHGAARVMTEAGLTGEALARAVLDLLGEREALAAMGEASRRLGRPEALEAIVRLIFNTFATGS